jgi:hypothetical protein
VKRDEIPAGKMLPTITKIVVKRLAEYAKKPQPVPNSKTKVA